MFDKDDLDTCGFPYVYGITQEIYSTTPIPESVTDAKASISELIATARDIQIQLDNRSAEYKLYQVEDDGSQFTEYFQTEYWSWRRSATAKLKIVTQQEALLKAWVKEELGFTDRVRDKGVRERIMTLEGQVASLIKEVEKIKARQLLLERKRKPPETEDC